MSWVGGTTGAAARLLVTSAFLLLLPGACAGGAAGPSGAAATPSAAAPTPSASSAAAAPTGGSANPLQPPSTPTLGAPVASDLQLSGQLSGRVLNAQPLGSCGKGPVGFSVALRFTLGGAPYVLSIDVPDYTGAGRYSIPPERVSIRSDLRSGTPTFLPATSGAVEVAAGEASGQLDAALGGDGVSHLKGSWSCH